MACHAAPSTLLVPLHMTKLRDPGTIVGLAEIPVMVVVGTVAHTLGG